MQNRTAFPLPRSVGEQVSVATLNGISGYHQFWFPSPLGLEVFAARLFLPSPTLTFFVRKLIFLGRYRRKTGPLFLRVMENKRIGCVLGEFSKQL